MDTSMYSCIRVFVCVHMYISIYRCICVSTQVHICMNITCKNGAHACDGRLLAHMIDGCAHIFVYVFAYTCTCHACNGLSHLYVMHATASRIYMYLHAFSCLLLPGLHTNIYRIYILDVPEAHRLICICMCI